MKQQSLEIIVDGKKLPLVPFVKRTYYKIILAMITELRGGESPGRIEIIVESEDSK